MSNRYYLDHAAGTLPSEQQKEALCKELFGNNSLLANPHSRHASGEYTNALVESARNRRVQYTTKEIIQAFRILDFFGASSSEYAVVFTQNATHALKMIAECFDFGPRTSVLKTISTDVRTIKRTHRAYFPTKTYF